MKRRGSGVNLIFVLLAIIALLQVASTAAGVVAVDHLNGQQAELEQNAYVGCEAQNTIREILRVEKNGEIKDARTAKYSDYDALFTRAEFRRLIKENIGKLRLRRDRLNGRDCESAYPNAEWEDDGELGSRDENTLEPCEIAREIGRPEACRSRQQHR